VCSSDLQASSAPPQIAEKAGSAQVEKFILPTKNAVISLSE